MRLQDQVWPQGLNLHSYCEGLHTVFFAHGRYQWTDASLLSTQTMTFDLKIEHFLGIFFRSFKQGQLLSGQQRLPFQSLHLRLSHIPAVPLLQNKKLNIFVSAVCPSVPSAVKHKTKFIFLIFRVPSINYSISFFLGLDSCKMHMHHLFILVCLFLPFRETTLMCENFALRSKSKPDFLSKLKRANVH